VIFTRNTTEALISSLIAGQHIFCPEMKCHFGHGHHSNFVPWQMLCNEREAKLIYLELTEDGQIDMALAEELIGPNQISCGHANVQRPWHNHTCYSISSPGSQHGL